MLDENNRNELNTIAKTNRFWGESFLFALAIFLLLWGLGSRSLWSSEGRWAEVTREMFVSHDFFHPAMGGKPYPDKPLATYWAIAFFAALTNRLDEFIVRLPSVIAALITLACTMYLGKRLWSRNAGMIAGGILLGSYGLMMYSRIASAETENLAAVMLAVAWYWSRRERPNFTTFFVFYLILFIGSHMKGLTAFVVPVLVILPDLIRQNRWKMLLKPSHWFALGIGICVYLAPFVFAGLGRTGVNQESGLLYYVYHENILRFFQPFDHKGPVYLYLYAVPLLLLPWIPVFVGSLITSFSHWKKLDEKTRWLIQAIIIIFVFFTLSGSRRNYYILPILPFCILLISVFITEFSQEIVEKHRERGLHIQKQVMYIAGVFEAVFGPLAAWILVNKKGWDLPAMFGWSCLIIGIAILIAGFLSGKLFDKLRYDTRMKSIWSSVVMACVLFGGLFAWQLNILNPISTEETFAMQLKELSASLPHERLAFFKKREEKVLFYMKWDPPVTILASESELKAFLNNKVPGIVIGQSREVTEKIAAILPLQPVLSQEAQKWESPGEKEEKLKAWLINEDNQQPVIEANDAN